VRADELAERELEERVRVDLDGAPDHRRRWRRASSGS
jgi:hypothetical protein